MENKRTSDYITQTQNSGKQQKKNPNQKNLTLVADS